MRKLALLSLLLVVPAFAQQDTPAKRDSRPGNADSANKSITQSQADAILQELKSIHQLLERQLTPQAPAQAPPPQKVRVSLKVDPEWQVLGRDDAPVTIIEFSDYQCPYCRKYYQETFAELKKNYIDTGKVRYVSRDFPLDFHPNAANAAAAAHCAGEQNKFWEMRDLLLGTSADLGPESIAKYSAQLKLDATRFQACRDAKQYSANIQKDIASAQSLGVSATPSFVIGRTTKTDTIEGVRVAGAYGYSAFQSFVQESMPPKPPTAAGH